MLCHSGGTSQMAWLAGNKRVEVRTDHRSLENWATEDLKTVGGPSPRQARWHELFSKFDLHVVYAPGPVNPVGDFLSRWAYLANPALGDVSVHGTAQADGVMRDMMAAEKEELLARLLVFRAVVTPVVTRSGPKAMPRATGAPRGDPLPQASAPVGGGTKQKKKLRRLEQMVKRKKSWKSHKKATPIQFHGEDAPNVFTINWATHYPSCDRYKKMWQDALNGNFPDGVRLVDNKLVRNGRWCVPMPLVHRLELRQPGGGEGGGGGLASHLANHGCTIALYVPFVNRPFESEIHGTVNFTYFCWFLPVTWCHCVLLSCYLRPK